MASWSWIFCLSFLALALTSQCAPIAEKLTGAVQATDDQEEDSVAKRFPLVISTWGFVEAVRAAWKVVEQGGSSLDAVVEGCSSCEKLRCDLSVGYGGSPDEAGETTLDAMIMDGGRMQGRKSISLDTEMFLQKHSLQPFSSPLPSPHPAVLGFKNKSSCWAISGNVSPAEIVGFNVVQCDEPDEDITVLGKYCNSDGKISFVFSMPNAALSLVSRDGQTTMDVGAVGALRSVKDAIRAARLVLDHSEHSLLVGDQASAFAVSLGIPGPSNLSTEDSLQQWSTWHDMDCQPNFRKNVVPDSRLSCGPYNIPPCHADIQFRADCLYMSSTCTHGDLQIVKTREGEAFGYSNHDTISMAVIDKGRKIAVGTSTNGASHKIPGRVGDGPIAGAAAYADDDVGACGATGDGDIMMRFVPCYQVVESMRRGKSPKHAAKDAIERIKRKYPRFVGAVFAVNRNGKHAGACNGWTFQYAVRGNDTDDVKIYTVSPPHDDS